MKLRSKEVDGGMGHHPAGEEGNENGPKSRMEMRGGDNMDSKAGWQDGPPKPEGWQAWENYQCG